MSKKLQGIIKGIKDLKKGAKKKVREDLVSKERRRKKMEAEKPLSARRDMAKKSRPETAKKRRERIRKKRIGTSGLTVGTEEAIAKGIIGATGAGAATVIGGNIYAGAKAGERRRRELAEKKRKQLFEKEKDKNKKPVKKAKGGMVTKWESKWG